MTTNEKGRNRGNGATPKETDHGGNHNPFGRLSGFTEMTSGKHSVGGGYTVQFTVGGDGMTVAWLPDTPTPRDMRRKVDLNRYRTARDYFLSRVAKALGGRICCVEPDGGELLFTDYEAGAVQ